MTPELLRIAICKHMCFWHCEIKDFSSLKIVIPFLYCSFLFCCFLIKSNDGIISNQLRMVFFLIDSDDSLSANVIEKSDLEIAHVCIMYCTNHIFISTNLMLTNPLAKYLSLRKPCNHIGIWQIKFRTSCLSLSLQRATLISLGKNSNYR